MNPPWLPPTPVPADVELPQRRYVKATGRGLGPPANRSEESTSEEGSSEAGHSVTWLYDRN